MGKKPAELVATHEGVINLGDTKIQCAVLEDGRRVLTQSDFMRALGRARQAKGRAYYDGDVELPAFLTAKNLKPFIDDDLRVTSSQVVFRTPKGKDAFGYSADLLPKVCDVFLKARDEGVGTKSQAHIIARADILMRGLAHVGITALVDEATGYQSDRARDDLERILTAFIAKEFQKWIKTFPDDFYEEMFRLKGWRYDPSSVKRPSLVGKYTNDLVYDRLAPGVLEELRKANPPNPKGNRRHRHHQWLTEDIGHPRLREHLSGVIAIMKVSKNWDEFKRHLNRIYRKHPRVGETLALPNMD